MRPLLPRVRSGRVLRPSPGCAARAGGPRGGLLRRRVSARIIAVMAVLRSRVWPGSQDTSHPFRLGACRAVWAVWSLVMVVSWMVRVMVRLPGRVRGRGGGPGRPAGLGQGGRGGRVPLFEPVAGGDDDHVVGGPAAGFAVVGLAGHWPASRSAAGWGWRAQGGERSRRPRPRPPGSAERSGGHMPGRPAGATRRSGRTGRCSRRRARRGRACSRRRCPGRPGGS